MKSKTLCGAHKGRKDRHGDVQVHIPVGFYFHKQSQNKSSTYRSWLMMRNRCNNSNGCDFKYYGAKGIKVCKRWDSFQLFREDMGDKPTPLHTIGRIDDTKNYEPKNCEWQTRKKQSRNRPFCKLNIQKAREIRKLYAAGMTQAAIAKKFKVGKTAVAYTVTGKSWAE